jgi:hypothetical protein
MEDLPVRPGLLLQAVLASEYILAILVLRCVMDVTGLALILDPSIPARASAASLPGAPEWPLTHWMSADREMALSEETCLKISLATRCPGPTPVWLALSIALVESE